MVGKHSLADEDVTIAYERFPESGLAGYVEVALRWHCSYCGRTNGIGLVFPDARVERLLARELVVRACRAEHDDPVGLLFAAVLRRT